MSSQAVDAAVTVLLCPVHSACARLPCRNGKWHGVSAAAGPLTPSAHGYVSVMDDQEMVPKRKCDEVDKQTSERRSVHKRSCSIYFCELSFCVAASVCFRNLCTVPGIMKILGSWIPRSKM